MRLFLAHQAASFALGWRVLREALLAAPRGRRLGHSDGEPVAGFSLEHELDPVGSPETRLPSVGTLLREAREAEGSDLRQISAALRLRPDHLRAIEDGNYAGLPAPAYAIGFIRSYAGYLGLDADEMVRLFKHEIGGQHLGHKLAFPVPTRERRVSPSGALVGFAILGLCAFGVWRLSADRQNRDDILALPAPALVAPAGNTAPSPTTAAQIEALSSLPPAAGPARSESPASHGIEVTQALRRGSPSQAAASPGTGAATSVPPPSTDSARVFGAGGDGHSRIALRATAETWIEAKEGDTSIFKRLLKTGDEYRLPEKPGLTLRIGNAHGIEVLVDGKPLPGTVQPSQGRRTVVTLEPRELLAKAGKQ